MIYDLEELEEMGATYRPGPGLTRKANEEWADVVGAALKAGCEGLSARASEGVSDKQEQIIEGTQIGGGFA